MSRLLLLATLFAARVASAQLVPDHVHTDLFERGRERAWRVGDRVRTVHGEHLLRVGPSEDAAGTARLPEQTRVTIRAAPDPTAPPEGRFYEVSTLAADGTPSDGFLHATELWPESRRLAEFPVDTASPGDALAVALDGVALQQEPSDGARTLATLPLGARVKVLATEGGPERRGARLNRWYQVEAEAPVAGDGGAAGLAWRRGYLFGGDLTPYGFAVDLDQDGEAERLTVAFDEEGLLQLRVVEPATGERSELALDELTDREVALTVLTARAAGTATLRLSAVPKGEGPVDDVFVTYRTLPGRTLGVLQRVPAPALRAPKPPPTKRRPATQRTGAKAGGKPGAPAAP